MNKSLPMLAAMCFLAASAAFSAGVGGAKLAPLGSLVTLDGVVTQVGVGECYVESDNRSAGIWVVGPIQTEFLHVGDIVRALGTRDMAAGEACVIDAAITRLGYASTMKPFSLNNRAVGGSTPGESIYDCLGAGSGDHHWLEWTKAGGASNVGLLIKTWGAVKSVYYSPTTGARWFYVDDGSGLVSDHGDTGLLVYSDAAVKENDFVAVTGVSSVERSFDSAQRLIRVIRTRDSADVAMLKEYQAPEYPFSDEFNASVLDPRWYVYPGDGSYSLSSRPGFLTLTAPRQAAPGSSSRSPMFFQQPSDARNIEIKVHVELNPGERPIHLFRICRSGLPQTFWKSEAVVEILTGYASPQYMPGQPYIPGQQYTSVVRLGSMIVPLTRDTCYIRLGSRVGVSFDGVNYIETDNRTSCGGRFLTFYTESIGDTAGQFSAYIDYFRYISVP